MVKVLTKYNKNSIMYIEIRKRETQKGVEKVEVLKTLFGTITTIIIFTIIIYSLLYKYNKTYRKMFNEIKKELSLNPHKVNKITHTINTLYNYFFLE